jgi:hypothetical protein
MPPPILLHGTANSNVEAIRREGLRQPWLGRGVALTADRNFALAAARTACLRERQERGDEHEHGAAALLNVDVVGLDLCAAGPLDPVPCWLTDHVGPERIRTVELVPVELPSPGSWTELLMLTGGFAARRRYIFAATLATARSLEKRSGVAK